VPGRLFHLTGGTTARSKVVRYDPGRWARSVAVKRKIFHAHGVDENARVAVCHPFGLWSIGQVHVEGALACHADVYPIGLSALSPEPLQHLIDARPTHLCGGARHLLQLADLAAKLERPLANRGMQAIFAAGEPLTSGVRAACAAAWGAPVFDVYGTAEFDALGAELPKSPSMRLVNDFEFGVHSGNGVHALSAGATGSLCVRADEHTAWFDTRDLICVVDTDGPSGFGAGIHIRGRKDFAVSLPDGSAISELQVSRLVAETPSLASAQLHVVHQGSTVELHLLYVPHPLSEVNADALSDRVRDINVDVADSVRAGVVRRIQLRSLADEGLYFNTARGKRPLIVVVE